MTEHTYKMKLISLITEINRISGNTEFNSTKLLDGTFTDKNIQIGTASNQVLRLGVASTDSTKLGAYQVDTVDESIGRVNSFASAKTAINAQFSDSADYVIKGTFGTYTAMVDAGADARDVASSFNLLSGDTGVNATAYLKQDFLQALLRLTVLHFKVKVQQHHKSQLQLHLLLI